MKKLTKWKKQAGALLLAVILACSGGLETVCVVEGAEVLPVQQEVDFYTITLDLAGGELDGPLSWQMEDGEILGWAAVEDPVRTGYLFQGWLDEDGEPYQFDQPVEDDITLTASWKPMTEDEDFPGENGDGDMEGSYTIHFDANGGDGEMDDRDCRCGKGQKLPGNKFKRQGYTFAGWNTKADGTGISYENKQTDVMTGARDGEVVTLYAMWQGITYYVEYDGNGADSGSMEDSTHIYGTPGELSANGFQKKGYTFAGWNTKANGKGTAYKDQAEVSDLAVKAEKTVTLYAQWTVAEYTITYHLNKGNLAKAGPKSYTTLTKTFSLPTPSRKNYDFDGWYTDEKFKNRVSEIKKGSSGNLDLYAKWVKCNGKAEKTSASITKCKATAKGKVTVSATVKNRVASEDDYYYLMYMDPVTKNIYKMAEKTYKGKKITYTLKTSQNQGYAVAMFGIAVKKNGKYVLISSPSFVGNVNKAATNTKAYNPGRTKKGIQFADGISAVADSGADQTFLNVPVSQICAGASVAYKYNGKTYNFGPMYGIKDTVQQCNKKGIVVTMQILLDWVPGQTDLITPEARTQGAAPYYCWNVKNNASREKMEAMFCYLGEVFGQKDCYVSNWILGNEINSARDWNYPGSLSGAQYFKTYAYAFRALYSAVKSQQANAQVFICLDHYWNGSNPYGYSAKTAMETFHKELNSIQKGVDWNLAFHPYSHPLTYTNVWEGQVITDHDDTISITMRNLQVLTDYMKRTYGSKKRVILSELGYTSSNGQEKNQAAAIAYSYYMAACNPMVDAIIFRSLDDNAQEVAQGLSMGIRGKEAYQVFKYMDTSKSLTYTNKYLGLIGTSSWNNVIPGYEAGRLTKMYRN